MYSLTIQHTVVKTRHPNFPPDHIMNGLSRRKRNILREAVLQFEQQHGWMIVIKR